MQYKRFKKNGPKRSRCILFKWCRPNQTGHCGYARMASAITGGKASAVDGHILKDECNKNSKPIRL